MLRPQQKRRKALKLVKQTGNQGNRGKKRLDAWKSAVASREMSLLYACGRYNNDIRAESAVAVWHAKGQSEGLFLANRMIILKV